MQDISTKIVMSGVQPSGEIHIGNYLGAIKNWKNFQSSKYYPIFFIADLHALTSILEPNELRKSVLETFAIYLASGIDYKESIMFLQSSIKEHTNFAWMLSCIIPKNRLNKMTQFKLKSKKNGEHNTNLGLFTYPVLMAADILLYKADIVPVGDDQIQHLEFTRDIVLLLNNKLKSEYFSMPEFFINSDTSRIMSLQNASDKMSKSSTSSLSRILVLDSKEEIVKKIKKAKTDALPYISYDKQNRKEVTNLINIYSSVSNIPKKKILDNYENCGMQKFKQDLTEILIEYLSPIRQKYFELMNNIDFLQSLMSQGNDKAQEIASKNYQEIKDKIGLIC
ncbi:MAG: tryptophan--tRNA ligase [Rickettsia sp.]|nr:tryptophan--tRNA ligase [Rickettsia sp.]